MFSFVRKGKTFKATSTENVLEQICGILGLTGTFKPSKSNFGRSNYRQSVRAEEAVFNTLNVITL